MPISKTEAADALRSVEQTERLSGDLRAYAASAPHFFIWGLAWAAGYGFSAAVPDKRNLIWLGVIIAGSIASAIAGARHGGGRRSLVQSVSISVAIVLITTVFVTVLAPMEPRKIEALIPLFVAGFYLLIGIWTGPRFAVAGVVLGAVTVAGYFIAGDNFGYWMAAAGGGVLVMTGLWLRSA
ncbi:MAG: hypothetical protein ACKVRO_17230 [Micropepsaceae bacterium]